MTPRIAMTDEEYKQFRKLVRLTLLRTALIWVTGILFLIYKAKHG